MKATFHAGELAVFVHDSIDALALAASTAAATAIRHAVTARGGANVMFATGNSQLRFIDALVARDDLDWAAVTVFHMDEYIGVGPDHPAGFQRWIRERIVARIRPRAANYIDGLGHPAEVSAGYARLLQDHPLDLCCLGIGENGHLAFNDPGVADFDDPLDVKVVELDTACRQQQVNEGHFPDLAAVPPEAVTVTVPALLRAGSVLAVVPEARKGPAVRAALEGPIEVSCPASALRHCAQATLHLDRESASMLSRL
jgi:glucosamine-6-phosphate deaminase